jgi:hypothetical protein
LDGLKVLGHGQLDRKLTVHCHRISKTAREAVEAKGGKIEILKTRGEDARKQWSARRGTGKSMVRLRTAKTAALAKAQAKKK